MNKFLTVIILIAAVGCMIATPLKAQNSTMDDVHLFQSFFRDAPVAQTLYAAPFINYTNNDIANRFSYGARGGYAVTSRLEVAAEFRYLEIERDEIGSVSGIVDVPVFARYNFIDDRTVFSGGAYATLPVGDEEIGEGNVDFGVFGAVRHPASEVVVLTGAFGIDFLETGIDREASLYLGAGVIYAVTPELSVLGDLSVQSDIDFSAISIGGDYKLVDAVRLRGNLLLGLDIGAPDFGLTGSLLVRL